MKTIIKAILKFFKLSKLSFIGLFILIFFSLSIFTVLNSTNVNLTESYQKVSTQGNLHDFVINENYKYGNGLYTLNTTESSSSSSSSITPNGDVDITAIQNSGSDNKTYSVTFTLNESLIKTSGSDYQWTYAYESFYNNSSSMSKYKTFTSTITLSTASSETLTTSNWKNNTEFKTSASSAVSSKSSSLTTDVQEYWKEKFISEVKEKTNTSIREFESINISNTKQNIFFKLIESSPSYSIDKIVIYDGNNLTSPADFSDVDKVLNSTSSDLQTNASLTRDIVKYFYKAQWTDTNDKFTKLYNYVNDHENYNPYTNMDGSTSVTDSNVKTQSELFKSIIDDKGITNNNYELKFSYSQLGLAPVSGKYEDLSSYGAIISPEYMSRLGKKPVNYNEWLSHLSDSQADFNVWLNSLSENTIEIDNQTFVILGTGISPDFMYPIVSFQNVVPNSNNEQVVYTNSSGYSKMVNSFRGNEQETFLVGKFSTTSSSLKKQYLDDINNISKQYMSWPSNINAAYMYDDTSNSFSPTALRVIFIPKIVSTISVISAYLTTFILLLSIFISVVIIKRSIESNRNSLGIMQANGYKKWEIITGVCFLMVIPTFIATILGYLFGLSLQGAAILILGGFWTIPTTVSGLSLSVFILIVIFVSLLFGALTVLFSWFCLRGETSEFMKDDSKYKMSKVAAIMKKPFSKFGILNRLRSAIAFSSFWRLLLLSIMAAILTSSLTFSVNVLHSFSDSAQKTYSPRNFTYSLDLVTPTLQSGQYYTTPYQQQGKTLNKTNYFDTSLASASIDYSKSDSFISQNYWQQSAAYSKYATSSDSSYNSTFASFVKEFGNYQLISQDDLNAQKSDIFYLKNKTTTKAFADVDLGLGSVVSNPWTIAAQLTPSNYSTYSSQSFQNMFQNSVDDNETKVNIGYSDTDTLYTYIKSFSKAYAVLKDEVSTTAIPTVADFGKMKYKSGSTWKTATASSAEVVTQTEIDNNDDVFFDAIDSNKDPNYDYYLEFDNSKIGGNSYQPSSSAPVTDINIYFLNLLYYLYSLEKNDQYTYSINYGKIVVDQQDTPYSYMDFTIDSVNNNTKNFTDSLSAIGLSNNFVSPDYNLVNDSNEFLNKKLWDTPTSTIERLNASGEKQTYDVYPIVINKYTQKQYSLNVGDIVKVNVTNSADRYSRIFYNKDDPVAYLKVIDVASTYQGSEFFMSQYDVNKILGLTIDNIKPKVPTLANEIKDYVDWSKTEYDYGNNYLLTTQPTVTESDLSELNNKDNFDITRSGFNGIFSRATGSLPEVTNGLSIYSVNGIYPGTDVISDTDSVMNALFSSETNMIKAIKQMGFNSLLGTDGKPTVTAKDLINQIANVFGTSSTFSIISAAASKTSSLDVLNITSATLTKIQDAVLGIIAIITVLIIVVISSLIINDSLKLAAILKCLGLNDRKNATSFLSVYVPVFIFGLLLSIPLTFLITSIYVEFVFGFAGILIVVNSVWWHFIASTIGIVLIFVLSYWSTWMKIKKMNLSKSIK